MDMRVAVVGGGSWGTTVAHLTAHNASTVLHTRREDVAAAINEQHMNRRYLDGYVLHSDLSASTDLAAVVSKANVLVMGVPSSGFRQTLVDIRPHIRPRVPIVSLAKGFEIGSRKRMTQLVEEELPGHPVGVLTGPNLAKEILGGSAAAAVLAFADLAIAESLQDVFSSQLFRVYSSTDVVGCELGGALKNVIALAAGMADGLGTGDNTRAAVMTRGLAEVTRLGVALGGDPATFAGLAGMGDLLATCMSPQSRNRYVGEQLGQGRTIEEIVADMNQVAEGVKSASIVCEIADECGVYMPIAEQMRACIEQGRSASDAYAGLVKNPAAREIDPD
jgi:glycerol-3-phosphate dehydrogenase (NAD(P)+)